LLQDVVIPHIIWYT